MGTKLMPKFGFPPKAKKWEAARFMVERCWVEKSPLVHRRFVSWLNFFEQD
jgi:hypothetical protein